ncbi:LysR family transcriptional regulator [Roseovarius rhodophyticola]|uniref:LysR family transcriptional regulator n=1 Tax=Roseovarius rhodophyticola TaxID=3080827 RepID=A0ABZ2TCT5_9RHOB|nr:LysR family transcriptional regulator [Roseovarius sp. W115]MDV2931256.1 LysR family transcriptional regulator [Roseovarius sp. W115]
MKPSQLSLRWLEVFLMTAQSGSVQTAAQQAGLSVSTVSHHLKSLETKLGTPLFDHSRRPLRVTAAGAVFQRDVEGALKLIRKAEAEAQAGSVGETRSLALALIEDFDGDIAPELARHLTTAMPKCRFRHLTRPSHEILDMLRAQEIDVGLAARPQSVPDALSEHAILRDPYVLALPAGVKLAEDRLIAGQTDLPFLRYSSNQLMARQIEQQLRRLNRDLSDQYEFESTQTLMRLVAEGAGWAITTPMNYLRAQRFHRQVRLAPFPDKGFARTLSIYATDLADPVVMQTVTETLRRLIETRAVQPVIDAEPWLRDAFRLLPVNRSES